MSRSYDIDDLVDGSIRNLVADSWRRSMQASPAFSAMPDRAYVFWASTVIDTFLGKDVHRIELRDGDFMLVARDRERPVYVLGWLLATDTNPGCAIAWAYVKQADRGQGVAADLIATAIERCEPGEVTYGIHTRFDPVWERLGFSYKPLQEFEAKSRKAGVR
jgi:GNAT superfamily N-acetyltransferase